MHTQRSGSVRVAKYLKLFAFVPVVLVLGLLNVTNNGLATQQTCGVSQDGFVCYLVRVEVQVFLCIDCPPYGRDRLSLPSPVTVGVFHFDEWGGVWRYYTTAGRFTAQVQSWVKPPNGFPQALENAMAPLPNGVDVNVPNLPDPRWSYHSRTKEKASNSYLYITIFIKQQVVPINPPPGQPPFLPLSGQVVSIVARHSGKCMDVWNGSRDNHIQIIQWDCHGGDNQKFELRQDGSYYQIVARHSGKCLDVWNASRDSGVNLIQWDCHGGDNQKFELRQDGSYYQMVAKHSGKCLDVWNGSRDNNIPIFQLFSGIVTVAITRSGN